MLLLHSAPSFSLVWLQYIRFTTDLRLFLPAPNVAGVSTLHCDFAVLANMVFNVTAWPGLKCHVPKSWLNAGADENMESIDPTFPTSHPLKSELKEFALARFSKSNGAME